MLNGWRRLFHVKHVRHMRSMNWIANNENFAKCFHRVSTQNLIETKETKNYNNIILEVAMVMMMAMITKRSIPTESVGKLCVSDHCNKLVFFYSFFFDNFWNSNLVQILRNKTIKLFQKSHSSFSFSYLPTYLPHFPSSIP